jgi:carbon-monoxide dehydrogenase iron sulfur subunit
MLYYGIRQPLTVYHTLGADQMKRVYIRAEVCIGCRLCEVYCQLQHARSKDLIKALKRESPRPLPRLKVEENGAVSFSVRCQHCDEAPCVYACLTGALTRDSVTGLIKVDEERCVGCWTCLLVCPLGAIRQNTVQKKMLKCDLCQGEDIPACVANCPNEALIYVEVQDGNPGVECMAIANVR